MIEVKRMKTENAWKKYADKKPVFDFCEGYKEYAKQKENVQMKL